MPQKKQGTGSIIVDLRSVISETKTIFLNPEKVGLHVIFYSVLCCDEAAYKDY
jgi:hypothetical protein